MISNLVKLAKHRARLEINLGVRVLGSDDLAGGVVIRRTDVVRHGANARSLVTKK